MEEIDYSTAFERFSISFMRYSMEINGICECTKHDKSLYSFGKKKYTPFDEISEAVEKVAVYKNNDLKKLVSDE